MKQLPHRHSHYRADAMLNLDEAIAGEIRYWGRFDVLGARRQYNARGELVCRDKDGITVYPVSWMLWDSVDF